MDNVFAICKACKLLYTGWVHTTLIDLSCSGSGSGPSCFCGSERLGMNIVWVTDLTPTLQNERCFCGRLAPFSLLKWCVSCPSVSQYVRDLLFTPRQVVVNRYYVALFSALEQSHCAFDACDSE